MLVKNLSGIELEFARTIDYMDDEIREDLHSELAPCSYQEFFTAYENAHVEKFGVLWFLSEEDALSQW